MHATPYTREIYRDATIEQIRSMIRRFSISDERAFLKSAMELARAYATRNGDDGENQRQQWIDHAHQTAMLRKELLHDCLKPLEAAELLRIKPQTMYRRIERGAVLSVKDGKGFFLPKWQFDLSQPSGLIPGLDQVLKAMKNVGPESKILWLGQPYREFNNEKPIDILKSGRIELILEYARAI